MTRSTNKLIKQTGRNLRRMVLKIVTICASTVKFCVMWGVIGLLAHTLLTTSQFSFATQPEKVKKTIWDKAQGVVKLALSLKP